MAARLDAVHPVLMCSDVSASIRFYERIGFALTFQDNPADPKYAAIRRDDVELHLQWQDASHWAYPIDRPNYRFYVQDVDGLHAEFQSHGAIDGRAPRATSWGTHEFHMRDPDGNGLQFYRAL